MRLTCPNCSAQYEVPDEVIPEDGREVQCSNCEKTWFQAKHADASPTDAEPDAPAEEAAVEPEEDAPEPEEAKAEPDATEEKSVGNVDPGISSILREEAAREAELRAREGRQPGKPARSGPGSPRRARGQTKTTICHGNRRRRGPKG